MYSSRVIHNLAYEVLSSCIVSDRFRCTSDRRQAMHDGHTMVFFLITIKNRYVLLETKHIPPGVEWKSLSDPEHGTTVLQTEQPRRRKIVASNKILGPSGDAAVSALCCSSPISSSSTQFTLPDPTDRPFSPGSHLSDAVKAAEVTGSVKRRKART